MKKVLAALGLATAMVATPAFADVNTVEAPTGFFAPGTGATTSSPYYRDYSQDWDWTHGAIGTPITSASLYISGYDVDFTEVDEIYAMDSGVWKKLGSLTQTGSNVFSFTTFALGANFYDDIASGLKVKVDIDVNRGGWLLTLGKSVLTTNNSNPGNPTPGVPEPATWLTMILGFGVVGSALRSRRKSALSLV